MTAYGALISLENTIENIWISYYQYQTPLNEILVAAYKEVLPLKEILERLDGSSKSKSRKKVNSLDGRIKQTLWNLEDLLESLLSDGIHSDDVERLDEVYTQLRDAVDFFIHTLKDMKKEYIHEVDNMPQDDDEEEEAADISLSSTSAGMIGLSDVFEVVKYVLTEYESFSIMSYAVVGMAGLGKTTLARALYEDPDIQRYYDYRVWITAGKKYDFSQVSPGFLAELLQDGERCLIVLDDVWEKRVLPIFITSLTEMKDNRRLIRILITGRGRNAIPCVLNHIQVVNNTTCLSFDTVLRFMNEEESKDLLCNKVFGEEETCPPQLDKAATKIAKNCQGLPLMILTVAKHLSNNRDQDYWNEVAEEKNSVFLDSYEEISKVVFPSYDYLPQRLKMPFLYLGVFPRDYDIPASKILNMLTAEGWLLDPNEHRSMEQSTSGFLAELCLSYILVLFKHKTIEWFKSDSFTMIKSCRLHSSWRHLCRGEARNNKFFHVLNKLFDATSSHSHSDSQEEDKEEAIVIKGQRGLCLENNILFGLKEFCNSVKSYCASSTRSLLFFGPYSQYPTPVDAIGFKLLRELDALQLRFYTFPAQILTLVQLKYLALTCNEQLPTTISKLSKLRTLIIHPHISTIKCHTSPSIIPTQIWDMPDLEHIEILGKSLGASDNVGACLINLSTLKGANADISNISELFKRIPNIKKLGVQMELTPYHDTSSSSGDLILSCFDCISTLEKLETVKCSIMNPVHVLLARSPHDSLLLSLELKKLHLSGMGFSWEYMMDAIASLPNLQVLKLRCHAFRGPKWEIREGCFMRLHYLAIEDSDLVEWKPATGSFPELNYLSLKHCYKLQKLQWPSDFNYGKIKLENCNPLAVTCARQLTQLPRKPHHYLFVYASDDF